MGINLTKGQNINLTKTVPGLNNLCACIGWEMNKYNTGGKYDLDISIFALSDYTDGTYKLSSVDDFCFYNTEKDSEGNQTAANTALKYSGDNRTGEGDGDDEFITIDLSKSRPNITNYSIIVSISDPDNKGLNFGSIGSCYVRLTNISTGEEILRYDMAEDFSTETAVQFGSLYLYNGEWKFKAIGAGYVAGLQAFLDEYNYVG